LEVVQTLEDLFLIEVLLVEVLGEHLDCLIHWVFELDALNCASVVRQHRAKMSSIWDEVDLVVDALTLHIQHELLGVVCASEGELLLELLVAVGREHEINCLTLPWLQGSTLWEHLEPFSFLGGGRSSCDIWLVVVGPVARYFFLVLEANLDCLAGLDADLAKIDGL
jgi:hypothetical protein